MKFIVFTYDFSGIPLALRLKEEGNSVVLAAIEPEMATDKFEKPRNSKERKEYQDKLDELDLIGKGMITKARAKDVVKRIVDENAKDVYCIFDHIYGFKYSEYLRKKGFKVWGATEVGYNLEKNREETLKLFKENGIDIPKQFDFGKGQADNAIELLQEEGNPLFAFKSDNPSVKTKVAEENNDELVDYINCLKDQINKEPFVLQEKKVGVEAIVETWYCKGEPILCDVDIELKKKYNEDSPVQEGCAAGMTFNVPLDSKIREISNKLLDEYAKKNIPTGILDLDFIYDQNEQKIYGLEVCGNRFGYNQFFELLTILSIPFGDFISSVIDEKFEGDIGYLFNGFGVSLSIHNDSATDPSSGDTPVCIEDMENTWLWSVYQEGSNLFTIEGCDWIGSITDCGENPEGAFAKLRERYEKFNFSSKWARDDYDKTYHPNLLIPRYRALKNLKLI